jgi:hypothetical protein
MEDSKLPVKSQSKKIESEKSQNEKDSVSLDLQVRLSYRSRGERRGFIYDLIGKFIGLFSKN